VIGKEPLDINSRVYTRWERADGTTGVKKVPVKNYRAQNITEGMTVFDGACEYTVTSVMRMSAAGFDKGVRMRITLKAATGRVKTLTVPLGRNVAVVDADNPSASADMRGAS
jgi:hypothetical protein